MMACFCQRKREYKEPFDLLSPEDIARLRDKLEEIQKDFSAPIVSKTKYR